MSPIAYALLRHILSHRDEENFVMEELTATLRSSKTAVRAAFAELEERDYLTYEQST